jgi:hypothetical protein
MWNLNLKNNNNNDMLVKGGLFGERRNEECAGGVNTIEVIICIKIISYICISLYIYIIMKPTKNYLIKEEERGIRKNNRGIREEKERIEL